MRMSDPTKVVIVEVSRTRNSLNTRQMMTPATLNRDAAHTDPTNYHGCSVKGRKHEASVEAWSEAEAAAQSEYSSVILVRLLQMPMDILIGVRSMLISL